MRRIEALLFFSTLSTSILAAESPRPRGVGPEFAKFYKDAAAFTCISNPSITLRGDQINDDYCDCPDGSDEPGTAACTGLSPLSPPHPISGTAVNTTFALPGYWCKNKGHIGAYISHTYVNDGVCDYEVCCDGSDEWVGVGGVKCEDRCKEIGKEWRKVDEARQKSERAALKKKKELESEALALRAGVERTIAGLEKEIEEKIVEEKELKRKFEEVERRERGKVVKTGEGKGNKVTILAGLAKQRVEELRGALVGLMGRRDALREKVKELEGILEKFKEEYNPNFNDEGVKRAVHAWEDYAAKKVAAGESDYVSAEDRDLDSISKEDTESEGINWVEWETAEEESDVEALYKFEEYLPGPIREWIHEKLTSFRVLLIENGILADNPNSGTESAVVTAARSAYQSVSDDLGIKQASLGDLKSDLDKDYGENDIFRALKGNCIDKDSGEYVYELCWLEGTKQKSKKGGSHTGMGNFVRFDKIVVDDEVGADGKGLGKGERLVLRYENGQSCWNGPQRQTTVVLACAEKDEVWKVVEEEKCLYRMDVGTPAVCEGKAKKQGNKDEL